jgi:hypothetical protein
MVEDFPCGKVVIDVGRRYITVYRCDGNGFVEDEERFKLPWLIDRKDAADMANAVFDVVYAWALQGAARKGQTQRRGGPRHDHAQLRRHR